MATKAKATKAKKATYSCVIELSPSYAERASDLIKLNAGVKVAQAEFDEPKSQFLASVVANFYAGLESGYIPTNLQSTLPEGRVQVQFTQSKTTVASPEVQAAFPSVDLFENTRVFDSMVDPSETLKVLGSLSPADMLLALTSGVGALGVESLEVLESMGVVVLKDATVFAGDFLGVFQEMITAETDSAAQKELTDKIAKVLQETKGLMVVKVVVG